MNRQDPGIPATAIALIVVSAACFTAIDAIVKYLGTRYSAPLLVLVRWGGPALLMAAVLGPRMRLGLLRTANAKLHVLRGLVLMLSSLCFFKALESLALADATGINYSTPILVSLMAWWFLRERLTIARWVAIAAGFVGILLIARPATDVVQVTSLFALAAALLNATFQILTRRLANDDLAVLMFYPSLVGAVAMSFVVPFSDRFAAFEWLDLMLFVAMGTIGLAGHFFYVQAFQRATASTIAPFTYTQLVWATLGGWLIFGTFPDAWALAGMVVIAGSAATLTWYERRRAALSRSAGAPRESSPMMVSPPGAGVAEIKLDRSFDALAPNALDLRVGESTMIPTGAGTPRTVIRTD